MTGNTPHRCHLADRWGVALRRRMAWLPRATRDQSGVTLIETIVAIGVVTVVLLAAGAAMATSSVAQRLAEATDRAIHLANDRLETIRTLPWDQVGLHPSSPGYTTYVADLGEYTVELPDPPTRPELVPHQHQAGSHGQYTVDTTITYARQPGQPAPTGGDYAAKRVRVTVSWTSRGKPHSVTSQMLRAPTPAEQIPSTITTATTERCTDLCRVFVTSGQVLANPGSGHTPIAPGVSVLLRAYLQPGINPTKVTATLDGTVYDLHPVASDKTTWQQVLTAPTVLPPGRHQVTFTATTATGTHTRSTEAHWGIPIDGTTQILPARNTWSHGSLVEDPNRSASTTSPPTGQETSITALCVDPSGRTYRYQGIVFDVTNIDDMDGPHTPEVTYTGTPTGGGEAVVSEPQYIGARSTIPGTTNTLRWLAGIPAGTTLGAAGSVTFTVAVTRPGDGVTIQASATVPVVTAATATSCGNKL